MSKKKIYKNDKPIILADYNYAEQIKTLDLKAFPVIDDFEIVTKDRGKSLGVHLYFSSSQYGQLASFPWWDNADRSLKEMNINDIPLGKMENPFYDLEQSWQILIWEKRDYVYVMQGEDPCCIEFSIWFKVNKDKYIGAWEKNSIL